MPSLLRTCLLPLLALALVPNVLAAPATPQLTFNDAVSWSAGAISQVGDSGPIHTATRWEYNDCGVSTDAIQLKSFRVSPDPPKPGHNLTIYATGTVTTLVDEGAYADIVVKLGLIKLLTKRFDVCEELMNANATLQCPITPGEYSIVQTFELPAEIPRAKFQVAARAFTQTDQPMTCVDIAINFLLPDL